MDLGSVYSIVKEHSGLHAWEGRVVLLEEKNNVLRVACWPVTEVTEVDRELM